MTTSVDPTGVAQLHELKATALDPAVRASIRRRVLQGLATRDRYTIASRRFYDPAKRALDVISALAAFVLALPFVIVVAALIKLDSRGPVFYWQNRLGKGGVPFRMLKFRTMFVNDGALPDELAAQNESTGPLFKMKCDPRITRVGRFLRRASLDELPQVYNVLIGEMSIVGPRPPLPRELAGYEDVQRRRLRVTPGLTGLWQVSGRSDLAFDEMVRLDMRYIEKRGLMADLLIVLKTVPCVLLGKGAY